jgi:hypothetical protein
LKQKKGDGGGNEMKKKSRGDSEDLFDHSN